MCVSKCVYVCDSSVVAQEILASIHLFASTTTATTTFVTTPSRSATLDSITVEQNAVAAVAAAAAAAAAVAGNTVCDKVLNLLNNNNNNNSIMAADAAMDTTCPSPELGDSRKRPLDDGTDDGTSKRSHFSTNGKYRLPSPSILGPLGVVGVPKGERAACVPLCFA